MTSRRRIRVAYWISKATCTHARAHAHRQSHKHAHTSIIITAFRDDNVYANAPHCCGIRTLRVFFQWVSGAFVVVEGRGQ
jgi:hypothetical protein